MEEHSVKVYIYDLSRGMARAMSAMLIGKQLDGIWHTGIVAYGQEWFYGGMGIESCPPGGTIMGQPDQVENLGNTQIPFDVFMQYLQEQAQSDFQPQRYHLFDHNCNTFSNEVAKFLTGSPIPAHITNLPQEVLSTPFGQMIKPMLDSMQVTPQGGHNVIRQQQQSAVDSTAASGANNQPAAATNIQSPSVDRDPPQSTAAMQLPTFKVDSVYEIYNKEKKNLEGKCSADVRKLLDEFSEYTATPQPTWSPSPAHIKAFDTVVRSADLSPELKGHVLALLQEALLTPDVVQLVVNEPQQHVVAWTHNIDKHPPAVQERLVKIACNCCAVLDGRTWLLLNKEWRLNGDVTCNRALVSRCVMLTVLSDDPSVQEGGAGLAACVTAQKVDEDTALEIGSALIEALSSGELSSDSAENCLRSVESCMKHNKEVSELANVMGLDVKRFSSKSATCEKLVDVVTTKYLTSANN